MSYCRADGGARMRRDLPANRKQHGSRSIEKVVPSSAGACSRRATVLYIVPLDRPHFPVDILGVRTSACNRVQTAAQHHTRAIFVGRTTKKAPEPKNRAQKRFWARRWVLDKCSRVLTVVSGAAVRLSHVDVSGRSSINSTVTRQGRLNLL